MKQLKRLRRSLGLTQWKLGQAADIPPWRITFAETGRVRLTSEELQRIKDALTKRAAELAEMTGRDLAAAGPVAAEK